MGNSDHGTTCTYTARFVRWLTNLPSDSVTRNLLSDSVAHDLPSDCHGARCPPMPYGITYCRAFGVLSPHVLRYCLLSGMHMIHFRTPWTLGSNQRASVTCRVTATVRAAYGVLPDQICTTQGPHVNCMERSRPMKMLYRGTSLLKSNPPPLEPPQGPRHEPTVGS